MMLEVATRKLYLIEQPTGFYTRTFCAITNKNHCNFFTSLRSYAQTQLRNAPKISKHRQVEYRYFLKILSRKLLENWQLRKQRNPMHKSRSQIFWASLLQQKESDFINQYKDRDTCDSLLQLSIHDLPLIQSAIWMFYERPK